MTQHVDNITRSSLAALDLATPQKKPTVSIGQFDSTQVPLSNISSDWVHVAPAINRTIDALDLAEISDSGRKKLESMDLINRSTELDQKAKDNGVDLAKKNFFKNLFSVALAGVGLGLSIAATVLTGGAGVPVMAASGVAFALTVADAGCAFADWRSKASGGEGLKMGTDAIGNAVFAMLDKMGMDDENANYWANTTSVVLKTALTVSTLWCSATSSASVPGAVGSALSMIKMGSSTTSSVAGMGIDLNITDNENEESKLKTAAKNAKQFESNMDNTRKLEQAEQESNQLKLKLKKLTSISDLHQVARQRTNTLHNNASNELALITERIRLLADTGNIDKEIAEVLLA
ncbi:hypothetical protein [uncultured Shewanella sp.]|uniref:hypothetical protein n=1 Tax=uncultured Shewanella sp. TaxID=173975 RepID=UPI002623EAC0|nr:hypothetical protein [uncultured Shewanella sp.]